jgi:putative transposase
MSRCWWSNGEGSRQILGIVEGAKKGKAGWSAFLSRLKGRGLQGVELIVSDACMGMVVSDVLGPPFDRGR